MDPIRQERRSPPPVHLGTGGRSTDRPHSLSTECWCDPDVEVVHGRTPRRDDEHELPLDEALEA